MDPQLAETTIKTYLNEIRNRLDKAAGIGRVGVKKCGGDLPVRVCGIRRRVIFEVILAKKTAALPHALGKPHLME